jgi:adenylate cyclase
MGTEIERKFLVIGEHWRAAVQCSERMLQGYLVSAHALHEGDARASVRVRLAGEHAWLNIKAAQLGIARAEYEYAIPPVDAETLIATLCEGVVEKIRHYAPIDGALFEIDEFLGANAGLVVAEIELDAIDAEFPLPAWLGREVSTTGRYYNVNLIDYPYVDWTADERNATDVEDVPCC